MMKSLSIRARMLLIAMLPAFIVATVLASSLVISRIAEIETEELQRAYSLAQGLGFASEYSLASGNRDLLRDVSGPVLSVPTIVNVKYSDRFGQTIVTIDADNSQLDDVSQVGLLLRPLIQAGPLLREIVLPITRTDLEQYDPLFGAGAPIPEPDSNVIGRLTLTVDLSSAYNKQLDIIKSALSLTLLAMLVTIPAAIWLANTVARPVRTLTRTVELLADDDHSGDTDVAAGGELGELGRGVAHLSRELQSFHGRLRHSTNLATSELQATLLQLELQNRELVKAREAAEMANAFKSDFLANMSHEIRSPMNTIIGTLSLLNHSTVENIGREQMDVINQSSQTLLALIDEILDISRIETGELKLDPHVTDLLALLNEVNLSAVGQAVDGGVELFIGIDEEFECQEVVVDSLRLKQVMVNLLNNAIKFTRQGYVALTIKTRFQDDGSCRLEVTVTDTGIGIPKERLDSIFSAFSQVDMSTTREQAGVGLGLHICKEIIALMNGDIFVESVVGEGSTFRAALSLDAISHYSKNNANEQVYYVDHYAPLAEKTLHSLRCAGYEQSKESPNLLVNIPNRYLPDGDLLSLLPANHKHWRKYALVHQMSSSLKIRLHALEFQGYVIKTPHTGDLSRALAAAFKGIQFKPAGYQGSSIPLPGIARQMSVLAIDDQEINIQLLKGYFDYLNLTAEYATSASEGIAMADIARYDLILIDLHMPIHDGFYVANHIRHHSVLNRETPLVAVTADAYTRTREKALGSGFDEFISKPVTLDRVAEIVNQWIVQSKTDSSLQLDATSEVALIEYEAFCDALTGNRDKARELLRLYKAELHQFLRDFDRAYRARDAEKLFLAGHGLKGSSSLFGVGLLSGYCAKLEAHCRSGNWSAIGKMKPELESLTKTAIIQCEKILTIEHESMQRRERVKSVVDLE